LQLKFVSRNCLATLRAGGESFYPTLVSPLSQFPGESKVAIRISDSPLSSLSIVINDSRPITTAGLRAVVIERITVNRNCRDVAFDASNINAIFFYHTATRNSHIFVENLLIYEALNYSVIQIDHSFIYKFYQK